MTKASPNTDQALIEAIAKLLNEQNLAEIEIEREDLRVRVTRTYATSGVQQVMVPAPAPVQCTSCSDGSGSAKGSTIAAFAASGNANGTSVTRALAPSTDEVTVTPGKRPKPRQLQQVAVNLLMNGAEV